MLKFLGIVFLIIIFFEYLPLILEIGHNCVRFQ